MQKATPIFLVIDESVKSLCNLEIGNLFEKKLNNVLDTRYTSKHLCHLDLRKKSSEEKDKEEIIGNHGFNISNSVSGAIGSAEKGTAKDCDITIGGKETRTIGGSYDIVTTDTYSVASLNDMLISAKNNITMFSSASTSIGSGTTMSVKAATTLDIKSEAVGTMTFEGNSSGINLSGTSSTVTAKNGAGTAIELTGHIHSQGNDSAGDTEVNTNAPIA